MHRQYFRKFDPLTEYPPETYCPANGYEIPPDLSVVCPTNGYVDTSNPQALGAACLIGGYIPDPTIYVPDEVVEDLPAIALDDEIVLIVSDQEEAFVAFACTTNSGQYTVKVYGNNDTLLSNTNTNSNTVYSYAIPIGQGVPRTGYTTYLVRITATTAGSYLASFAVRNVSGYNNRWRILAAKFKTANMTSLSAAFKSNPYITYCEFVGTMNYLTTMANSFELCASIQKVIMPTSSNLLNSLVTAFKDTPSLKSLELIDSYPALTNMGSLLYGTCAVENFVMPSSLPVLSLLTSFAYDNKYLKTLVFQGGLPELTNIGSFLYGCNNLKTIVFPTSWPKLNYSRYAFNACYELEGDLVVPEFPLMTTMDSMFAGCRKVNKVKFQGTGNYIATINALFNGCWKVIEVELPRTALLLDTTSSTMNCFNDCFSLLKIVMPDAMEYKVGTGAETAFFYNYNGCLYVSEMTTMATWPNRVMDYQPQFLRGLLRFDQPNAKLRSGSWNLSGGPTVRCKLQYYDQNWQGTLDAMSSGSIAISISYGDVDIAECERIINKLPKLLTAVTGQLSLVGNPCFNNYWSGQVMNNGYYQSNVLRLVRSYGVPLANLTIGAKIFDSAAFYTARTTTMANSIFTKTGHNMPNGEDISFASISGSGYLKNTTYYIVNRAADTFQISETLGGNALTLTGSGACVYRAFPTVVAIGANYVEINFQFEGANPAGNGNIAVQTGRYMNIQIVKFHKGWIGS
jgi:hypothetical protein